MQHLAQANALLAHIAVKVVPLQSTHAKDALLEHIVYLAPQAAHTVLPAEQVMLMLIVQQHV